MNTISINSASMNVASFIGCQKGSCKTKTPGTTGRPIDVIGAILVPSGKFNCVGRGETLYDIVGASTRSAIKETLIVAPLVLTKCGEANIAE